MKLSQFKEKKNSKKVIIILIAIVLLIGGIIIGSSFASFKENKSFKVMEGNFIYEGSGDIIFAFYQNGEEVGTMPGKNDAYIFNANDSFCDNGATISWDKKEWGPNIRNLTKTKTKCNLYFSRIGTLRQVSIVRSTNLWEYKDKITKIVIETTRNKKEADAGQIVHGPFDETTSYGGNSRIESYVVCDTEETNCIGYLQGDGGIKLNDDSSYLFADFSKLTQIEGMENLYTSNVYDMRYMFSGASSLQELDLSNFDTSSLVQMRYMFYQTRSLQELDLSTFDTHNVIDMYQLFGGMTNLKTLTFGENFDTSSVDDMSWMFSHMSSIEELDLSGFDTSNVENMEYMFYDAGKLSKITYGPNFIHKDGARTAGMFMACSANKPDKDVHPSWEGVSL